MSVNRNRLLDFSERMYRRLLSAYPASHRRQYGQSMAQTFADLCRDTFNRRGAWGLLAVWTATLRDTVSNALTEHVAERIANMTALKQLLLKKFEKENLRRNLLKYIFLSSAAIVPATSINSLVEFGADRTQFALGIFAA